MVYDGDLNTIGSFSALAERPVALLSSRLLPHTFFNDLTLSMGKLRLCSVVLGKTGNWNWCRNNPLLVVVL